LPSLEQEHQLFRYQFHQHFTRAFFIQKCFFCQYLTREKLREALVFFGAKILFEKCARKMLMKSMAGINFINVLCAAFERADPECAKKTVSFYAFRI